MCGVVCMRKIGWKSHFYPQYWTARFIRNFGWNVPNQPEFRLVIYQQLFRKSCLKTSFLLRMTRNFLQQLKNDKMKMLKQENQKNVENWRFWVDFVDFSQENSRKFETYPKWVLFVQIEKFFLQHLNNIKCEVWEKQFWKMIKIEDFG